MSTFGVWDPYWNGLDRFEHDDFAGSSPGVFQHLPDHLQNLPSCCSNSIPHLGSKMTSSLQALVWVYDTERYPFYQAGAARTRASNLVGVLVWGTLDPGSFLEVHWKSKRCSS